MTVHYAKLTLPLSTSPAGFEAMFNAWAAAVGPMSLINVMVLQSPDLPGAPVGLQVAYDDDGDTVYVAQFFAATAAASVDVQVAAEFAAAPADRPVFCLDVSSTRQRDLLRDAVLVIRTTAWSTQCASTSQAFLGSADAEILPLATGTVTLVGEAGPSGHTLQVINFCTTPWTAGAFGYVAKDAGSCLWMGAVTCCAFVPPPP